MDAEHETDVADRDYEALAVVNTVLSRHPGLEERLDWLLLADAAERELQADIRSGVFNLHQLKLWQAVTFELRRRGMKSVRAAVA